MQVNKNTVNTFLGHYIACNFFSEEIEYGCLDLRTETNS